MLDKFHYKQVMLGILGGMGPITSAQFVRTIYQLCDEEDEHYMPRIRLVSEPDIPDRSTCLKASSTTQMEIRIASLLEMLEPSVDRLLICCFTAHVVVPLLSDPVRSKLVNLVAYSDQLLNQLNEKTLFVATEGVYQSEIFPLARYPNLVTLDSDDLRSVHHLIYNHLKTRHDYAYVQGQLAILQDKYGCRQIFGGCTEMHLLKTWDRSELAIVDPLYEIALEFTRHKSFDQ
jgi:aspartate racemase